MAKLTFALEDGQEVVVPLTDHLTIGRAEGNDVVVNDEGLSAQHAELRQKADGSIEVNDLGSSSGTFVNELRVQSRTLRHGDRLAFGPLTAILDLEEPAAETTEAAEKRLAELQAAAQEAEATHREWLAAIQELVSQHEEKNTALQTLTSDVTAARQKITALTAQRLREAAGLEQLRQEAAESEAQLTDLRQQLGELEQRRQESQTRATTLQDQITAAEKALDQLSQRRSEGEAHLQELTSAEEKLAQILNSTLEAEARHTALSTAITALGQDQQRGEDALRHLRDNLASCESLLATRRTEIAAETQRLEQTKRRHATLETQCRELAATQQKHAQAREQLTTLQKQQAESQKTEVQDASPPAPTAVPTSVPRTGRIVAIESPRFTVIPMKSERILKKTPVTPPRKES